MPNLTFQQALDELDRINGLPSEQRLAELESLVQQTDARAPTGRVGVLYSGEFRTSASGRPFGSDEIARLIATNNPQVAIIDDTPLGRLLSSQAFKDALLDAVDGNSALQRELLGGASFAGHTPSSFWGQASQRFVGSLSGPIATLVGSADPGRIFGAVELQAALANPNVTSIAGIDANYLRGINNIDEGKGDTHFLNAVAPRNKTCTLCAGESEMARLARIVAPNTPHHVTQRGNRRQRTFFSEADYLRYLQLASEWCAKAEVECWGYCLMPNHVHLILTPKGEAGLRAAIAPLHWRYTFEVNKREGWRGYLWQGRFASYPMDEDYFVQASRYVGLNPVRAGLVTRAEEWPWSSVRAHLSGRDDALVRTPPLLRRFPRGFGGFFETDVGAEALKKLRRASSTGRPLGGAEWAKAVVRCTP